MSLPTVQGPLVLTLALDEPLSTRLNELRQRFFPPHRNHLAAHVTLFHAVPPHRLPELDALLSALAARHGPFAVAVGEPRAMGRGGVMLMLEERGAPRAVERIHAGLRARLGRTAQTDADRLTNQDMQTVRRGHVVVLNKAEKAEDVERCLEEMARLFDGRAEEGSAVGLDLWEYQGAAWKFIKRYEFAQPA